MRKKRQNWSTPAAKGSGGRSCLRGSGRGGEGLGADVEGLLLVSVEKIGERLGQAVLHEALEILQHGLRKQLAGLVPDDGAELHVGVEGQAVIDGVDQAFGAEEAVAALPVCIVGDEVPDIDLLEALAVARVFAEGKPVLPELGLDEELDGSVAVRALRGRDQHHAGRVPAPHGG